MATNLEIITRVRDMLNEATATQWSDTQLRRWMNDGAKHIARETHFAETNQDIDVAADAQSVAAPTNVLMIQHVYWIPDSDTDHIVPLVPKHYEQMDALWGSWQNQTTGEPVAFAPRGVSPSLRIYMYPTPDEAGTLRVFHTAIPTDIATDTSADATTSTVPDGWVDLLVDYVEYRALRRDRDPRWQEAKQLFDEKLEDMAQYDTLAIAREMIHDVRTGGVPRWLADPDFDLV